MIRNAVPADLDAIAALHGEARASYYRGHIADELFDSPAEHARMREGWEAGIGRGAVLCAERDGAVAGVAASREIDGVMNLTQFHVDSARRRTGVGTELHAACVASWRRAGVTTVRLEVFAHNTRAQRFYARQGWFPDPDEPRLGNHLVLRLELNG
ncbi:GNAT family N-acetyltransferase [Streptomyces sp. PKU-EA00015]|uniref:GNAT family N-acetyltransferase n=1 Tax=Streptomyces sp. PKU-EA00015 TaxID=2748326 RepID=UPI0015A34DBE|nr:GNAT family N-acetyltransferase [Streptomyces sp. PKU-EA00015]NWF26385.1 GNAT family N-acetyltransferase [Streptomyces sp. PKU-EA00015]